MRFKLIVFTSFFAAGLYLAQPLFPEHGQQRMNLKFERDKTYTFKVTSTGIPELAPRERVPPTIDPATDPSQPRDPNRPQKTIEGTPVEGAFPAGACELECRFKVKENTQGMTTLTVNFDRTGSFPDLDSHQPAPGDPGLFGSFEVVVDPSGRVVASASGSEVASKAGDPAKSVPAAKAACPPALRACLEVIFGAGLHDQMLQEGKVYDVGSPLERRSLPGTPQVPRGTPPAPERPKGASEPPPKAFQEPALPALSFRYEGSHKRPDSDGDLARFTVLANPPNAAPGAGPLPEPGPAGGNERPASERQPGEKPVVGEGQERRESLERGTAPTQERAGEAAYCWQDGMMESFSVTCPGHKGARDEAPRLNIRRVEREGKAERQEK